MYLSNRCRLLDSLRAEPVALCTARLTSSTTAGCDSANWMFSACCRYIVNNLNSLLACRRYLKTLFLDVYTVAAQKRSFLLLFFPAAANVCPELIIGSWMFFPVSYLVDFVIRFWFITTASMNKMNLHGAHH